MNFKERLNPTTTTKVIKSLVPRIGISADAITKMFIYVQECIDEIGWLGTVRALESGKHFIIEDVFLFNQNVHGATTEITPEGLASFAEELMQQPNGVDTWNRMQLWGHSHVNMSVNPSGQDDKQMDEFGNIGHDFFIRLIANKHGEIKIDFYDFKQGIIYTDIPWQILQTSREASISEEIIRLQQELENVQEQRKNTFEDNIKEEIKEKVHKITYQYQKKTPTVQTGAKKQYDSSLGHWEGGVFIPHKKKVEETKGKTEQINLDVDWFKTDDEVMETFSTFELNIFSEINDFNELREELEVYGWHELTDNDIERTMRVSKKFVNIKL